MPQGSGGQFFKIQFQNILAGFPADIPDSLPLRVQLMPHSLLDTQLSHGHQGASEGVAVNFFQQIHAQGVPVKIFRQTALLDAVVEGYIPGAEKSFHIRLHFQGIIPADRPHQIADPVFHFQTVIVQHRAFFLIRIHLLSSSPPGSG